MPGKWMRSRVYTYRGAAHMYEVVQPGTSNARIRAWPLDNIETLRELVANHEESGDDGMNIWLRPFDERAGGAHVMDLDDASSESYITVTSKRGNDPPRADMSVMQLDIMSLFAWLWWRVGRTPLMGVMFYGQWWPRPDAVVLYETLERRELHSGREWQSRKHIAALLQGKKN